MDDKLFLIAIGGTGMRCLESFVHLCAAGMFDGKTIEILTLDTDQANGNKGRVESLIELYNKVKTIDPQSPGGEPRSDTFFSAKINLYRFFTDYSTPERKTYERLSDTARTNAKQREDNEDLAALFFDPASVQQFPLDHGYRAQTHLGSLLMYHGIVESALNAKRGGETVKAHEKELQEFLQLLNRASGNARVFVFGSVFGGTGASSIPVIPRALRDAMRVISDGNADLDPKRVNFGSTLLTDYFTFDMPDDKQKKKDKVIADSANFALNSQAALSFYNSDLTVKDYYRLLYHIGWPETLKINYSENHKSGQVITGGKEQENPCHVVEMMCACAAYDFFTREEFNPGKVEYLYRTVEETEGRTLRLTGASFVGDERGAWFEQKLGNFLSFAHVVLSRYRGAQEGISGTIELLNDFRQRKVDQYSAMPDEQARNIDSYLQDFAYRFNNGNMIPGWLHQVRNSVSSSPFIFSDEALSKEAGILSKMDAGGVYKDDKYNWASPGLIGSKEVKRFDNFLEKVKKPTHEIKEQQGTALKEKFLAHMYNAIIESQKTSDLAQ